MNGDYLKIEHVENGYVIVLNEYSSAVKGLKRGRWVAYDESHLIEIVRKVFPDAGDRAVTDAMTN